MTSTSSSGLLRASHHDATETGSHHAGGSSSGGGGGGGGGGGAALSAPPLLLPPPAFATVAPDIYRCSSSFPTAQDIANASLPSAKGGMNSSGAGASHGGSSLAVHTSSGASSAAGGSGSKDVFSNEGSSRTHSRLSAAVSSSSSSSTSQAARGGDHSGAQHHSRPARSRVNSSSSAQRHTSALSAAAASYTPFLDSLRLRTVLVLGWERPSKTLERYCRQRDICIVHLGLDGSRIGPPSRVASKRRLEGAASGSYAGTPGGDVVVTDYANPTSSRGRISPAVSATSSSSASATFAPSGGAFDMASLAEAIPRGPHSSASSIAYGSAASMSTSGPGPPAAAYPRSPTVATADGGSMMSPPLQGLVPGSASAASSIPSSSASSSYSSALAPPPLGSGATPILPSGASSVVPAGMTMGGAAATVTGSLFSASAHQAGFISERMVKDGLELILDRRNHPVLIMDTSGIQETGVLVGCLRRMQRWDFASIVVEYRSFAGTRSRVVNERFIEMFDTDLTTLPPPEHLPPFFADHLLMDEEELDRQYGLV